MPTVTWGIERPDVSVLEAESLLPSTNRIDPPANVFSHVTAGSTPFFYALPAGSPVGHFPANTRLLLVRAVDGHCHVVDERGLYVVVRSTDLAPDAPADQESAGRPDEPPG